MKQLKDLKAGDLFTLKPIAYPKDSQVYIKCSYDRSTKKYDCQKWSDVSAYRSLKGSTIVYTDFIF